jgi:MoxR-like ATPase
MTYLSRQHELEVLARWKAARKAPPQFRVPAGAIVSARRVIQDSVQVAPAIQECLVDIAAALRSDRRVALGASTRSLVLALPALQARAALLGRDFVSPQDVKALAVPLFSHRLELARGARDAEVIVTECVAPVVEVATRRTLA